MRSGKEVPFEERFSERSALLGPENDSKLTAFFIIPQRWVLGLMGFLAVVNAYLMRVVLSIAITEMVHPVNKTGVELEDSCPDPNAKNGVTTLLENPDHLYHWDEHTQGIILSSFYWGYVITHMPGGILAERFGGKYSLGLGILSTAVFTLMTPWVVKMGDWPWLIVLRVFVGLGEGTTFPALNAMLAKWVPVSERSTLGTLVYAGAQMGNVVGNAASGLIIGATGSWESVFYVFGGVGILWFVIWVLLCYSEPSTHPFITDAEKKFLERELASVSNERRPIPWKHIFKSVPLWALVVAQLGHDWGLFTMVADLPKYMKSVLKFNVKENGLLSALPYLVMWCVSMVSGWLCDKIIMRGYMTITFARKFFTTVASLGPGIFLVAASYSGCDRVTTVAMFTVGMGFMGTFYCGMKVNALDLSPNFAGTLMAIVNGLGAVSGIITPYLVGAITEDQTAVQWRSVFWITLVVLTVTAVIFVAFGSGEEQWWNAIQDKDSADKVEEGKEKDNANKNHVIEPAQKQLS